MQLDDVIGQVIPRDGLLRFWAGELMREYFWPGRGKAHDHLCSSHAINAVATDDSRITRSRTPLDARASRPCSASVVGRDAEPIAVRPWQRFRIGGVVHIAGGRD